MEEHIRRYYTREEEFLAEFYNSAAVAAQLLGNNWRPNPDCTDKRRRNRDYFLNVGQQSDLVFDGALVFHTVDNLFSSVEIALKSSSRTVTVRVRWEGKELFAEKIVDRVRAQEASAQ